MTRHLGNYQYYLDKQNSQKNRDNAISKESILMLEMELSSLSFKLLNCKEDEKEYLEKHYLAVSSKLKKMKDL